MYVDDNIVKRTVINNVNMFFLNKDFNKIASDEGTFGFFFNPGTNVCDTDRRCHHRNEHISEVQYKGC